MPLTSNSPLTETATFAGGCFWCTEAVFGQLAGVLKVVSGYTGGTIPHPTYEQVSSGQTGHAEAVQITFNPSVISYENLLAVFWTTHDPTQLNRQGADIGTQYRSTIFYHSPGQQAAARQSKAELESTGIYSHPIVTGIESAGPFYPAEAYHQRYYQNQPDYPYCQVVINPKLAKLRQKFSPLLKKPTPAQQ